MSIAVNWGDPDRTTLQLTFERGWTWENLKQAIAQADMLIEAAGHTVHLIIDLRGGGGVPRDFLTAAGDLFAQGEARPNEGTRVIVGAGVLLRGAYRSLQALYGTQLAERPFLFAASPDEAQQLIAAR
ncbi:MAG: hypothetical protein K8J31_00720 [Anaerolineae bacterium]|nr:hypothetical protein [Anaerolineae bacterium]